jgi:hypothetical protein
MHAFTCRVIGGRITFFQGLPSATRLACSSRHTLFGENAPLGPFLIPSTLETPVLVFKGLHLANHRCVHPAILRTPFVERRVAPSRTLLRNILPVSASRARGTAQRQAHRLRLGAGSQGFGVRYISSSSSKSPQISCRENSTSASP